MNINGIVNKLDSIEMLRFIAATSVVFVHIPIVGIGHFGVDIFFIISGFVMMLSTERNNENFFLKRLIRILPTYYFFTACVFIVALTLPDLLNNTTADWTHLIKSLLFVPFDKNGIGNYPILFLGWTLNYEMYFYALFAISLFIYKARRASVTTVILAAVFILTKRFSTIPLNTYSDAIVFEFVIGMLLFHLLIKQSYQEVLFMVFIVSLTLLLYEPSLDNRFFYYGIPSAYFVTIVLILFRNTHIPRLVVELGGASYALYLTHPYVIQFLDKVTDWFSLNLFHQLSALIISIILVNLLAIGIHRLIEIPITKGLRERLLIRTKLSQ